VAKSLSGGHGYRYRLFYLGRDRCFGLGALLAASEVAYNILKWCGRPIYAG
jgi:hypothetical protein